MPKLKLSGKLKHCLIRFMSLNLAIKMEGPSAIFWNRNENFGCDSPYDKLDGDNT